ncbi:MAG: hypothetical protein MJA29_11290, partial [Candidatus Omnitrophica bacterium]|nr:hypothetical protein [Candidatus Omnitrophota bacterium]
MKKPTVLALSALLALSAVSVSAAREDPEKPSPGKTPLSSEKTAGYDRRSLPRVTLFYTGQTHAMLYPCNCPTEPDGGIARRAALLKLLRAKYPASLVLDSGGFFASGAMDEYAQNTELDKRRTEIQVRALDVMAYDAVCVGDEEFHYGADYLLKRAEISRTPFVSCNINDPSGRIKPYLVKETGGIKLGIIGITPLTAAGAALPLEITAPLEGVKASIQDVRAQGAQVVVALSHQGEIEDRALLEKVDGIDILVMGQGRGSKEPYAQVENTVILRPSWQGRRLGKATFVVGEAGIADFSVEEIRLSSQIKDDPRVTAFLPQCFTDSNCRRRGLTAYCAQAGTPEAQCELAEAHPVSLQVITSEACVTCHPEFIINGLRKHFPLLEVSFVPYPGERARQLIDFTGAEALPVYLLGEEAAAERNFALLEDSFRKHGPYYMLLPEASGISFFFDREEEKGRFDLFVRVYDERNDELFEVTRKFNPRVHLVVREEKEGFRAAGGNLEVEDALRS